MRAGREARRLAYERQQAAMAANRQDVTDRMVAAYQTETDREYAEEMWGEALRERGVKVEEL